MSWSGKLVFGQSWAVYRGTAADNSRHAHAAIQLALGEGQSVSICAADGTVLTGPGLAVRPMVQHRLAAQGDVVLLYIEPQSSLADRVLGAIGNTGTAVIDPSVVGFTPGIPIQVWGPQLDRLAASSDPGSDPRLLEALAMLGREPGQVSIRMAARACGISESRLRALGRAQLGIRLSAWLIWRKLERATQAMQNGQPLAQAAVSGGFSDQAHFTRAMRRMFGITPRTAQQVTLADTAG